MRNLLMCDFQVPKRFEHRSFEENVARHGSCIIGSIENTEINVYEKVLKKMHLGHKYCFEIHNMKIMYIFTLKILWTLKNGKLVFSRLGSIF